MRRKKLTYRDFSGKDIKERTLDELQQAKYEMENGAVLYVDIYPLQNGHNYRWVWVGVPELNFETGKYDKCEKVGEFGKYKKEDFKGFVSLLNRITHEISLRADTVISKKELLELKKLAATK